MPDLPHGSVTMADLYQAINSLRSEVFAALSRLHVIESRNKDADTIHTDHESRLRTLERAVPTGLDNRVMSLEKFRWSLAGALLLLNALSVFIGWLVTHHP